MNKLQVFKNTDFGEIRTIEENGNILFCGNDVAKALGYVSPKDAITRHCKGALKRRLPTSSGKQLMSVIPEGDLYRLIVNSKLPSAEKFESWVFDEVLPAIRKTGKYEAPAVRQRSLGEVNSAARIITQTLKEAGMAPQFRAVALQSLYAPVGVNIPLDGITVEKKLYEVSEIARMLGLYSVSGRPHGQAVSAVISLLGLEATEREVVPFQNQASGHSGTNYQYTESVLPKVHLWLKDHSYPERFCINGKNYKVSYHNTKTA